MKKFIYAFLFIPALLLCDTLTLSLGKSGSINYQIENERLLSVSRIAPNGSVLYTHSYEYNECGHLIKEHLIGDLGTIEIIDNHTFISPYSFEQIIKNEHDQIVGHTIDETTSYYKFNAGNELSVPNPNEYYKYDCDGDLIQRNDLFFEYDENHRLISSFSNDLKAFYFYDVSGQRTHKIVNDQVERYIYAGNNIIATVDENDEISALRVPGLFQSNQSFRPIAIETSDGIFAPIIDYMGNIRKLINIETKEIITYKHKSPFGKDLEKSPIIPWIFAGKHLDRETGLIYFGGRYYCPDIFKWTTPDPLFQKPDPHQYCLNNPLLFHDPTGKFAWSIPIYSTLAGLSGPVTWLVGGLLATKYAYDKYQEHRAKQQYLEELQRRDQLLYEQHQRERADFKKRLEEVKRYKTLVDQANTISKTDPLDGTSISPTDEHHLDTTFEIPEMPKWDTDTKRLYDLIKNTTTIYELDIFKQWISRTKKGSIDYTLPADISEMENSKDWKETTHPKRKLYSNRRTFENIKTGEKLDYDFGVAGEAGHRAHDHFHRRNPYSDRTHEYYLDIDGKPIHKNSESSHLYSPKLVWWLK